MVKSYIQNKPSSSSKPYNKASRAKVVREYPPSDDEDENSFTACATRTIAIDSSDDDSDMPDLATDSDEEEELLEYTVNKYGPLAQFIENINVSTTEEEEQHENYVNKVCTLQHLENINTSTAEVATVNTACTVQRAENLDSFPIKELQHVNGVVDTGADTHAFADKGIREQHADTMRPSRTLIASFTGAVEKVLGRSDVALAAPDIDGKWHIIRFKNSAHIATGSNLIDVDAMLDDGFLNPDLINRTWQHEDGTVFPLQNTRPRSPRAWTRPLASTTSATCSTSCRSRSPSRTN